MELAEQRRIRPCEDLDPLPQHFVTATPCAHLSDTEPGQQPARIGVDNKHRSAESIEENAIGSLRTDTRERQQRRAKDFSLLTLQPGHLAGIQPPTAEPPYPARLLPIAAGRPYQSLQFAHGGSHQIMRSQQIAAAQGFDRPRCVVPVGVLHQDGADTDLEWRLTRPPVLSTIGVAQRVDQLFEARSIELRERRLQRRRLRTRAGRGRGLVWRRGGGCPPARHKASTSASVRSRKWPGRSARSSRIGP